MRLKNSRRVLAVAAVLGLGLAGCSRGPSRVIGVVAKGSSHIFWQTVHAGAIKAGQETGYEILWNAPAQEGDRSRQIAIVEAMVNQRVSGIALAPNDRSALSAVVERATAAGIPVMIFDSGIDTPKRLGYVGTDNREGGRVAARRMAELLQGKGKVAIVSDTPGSASTTERDEGFTEEIRAKAPGISLLEVQFCEASRAKARTIAENLLAAQADLTAIFADHENANAGAVLALKARDRRSVKLIGFDASEPLVQDLKDGWIDSIVVQNPFRMGYESVKGIVAKLGGGTPPATIDTGVTLVRVADLDKAEVMELLLPKIEKYLGRTH
jgi:ribose transport system substrate-binding protein